MIIRKRFESLKDCIIGFIVNLWMLVSIISLVGVIFIVLYYMIRTKIDKFKERRAKRLEKKKSVEYGQCMIYKGKVIYS